MNQEKWLLRLAVRDACGHPFAISTPLLFDSSARCCFAQILFIVFSLPFGLCCQFCGGHSLWTAFILICECRVPNARCWVPHLAYSRSICHLKHVFMRERSEWWDEKRMWMCAWPKRRNVSKVGMRSAIQSSSGTQAGKIALVAATSLIALKVICCGFARGKGRWTTTEKINRKRKWLRSAESRFKAFARVSSRTYGVCCTHKMWILTRIRCDTLGEGKRICHAVTRDGFDVIVTYAEYDFFIFSVAAILVVLFANFCWFFDAAVDANPSK